MIYEWCKDIHCAMMARREGRNRYTHTHELRREQQQTMGARVYVNLCKVRVGQSDKTDTNETKWEREAMRKARGKRGERESRARAERGQRGEGRDVE